MVSRMFCVATAVVLVVVVTSSVAAAPTQCCWSPQWEGIVDEKLGVYNRFNNYASIADINTVIHVDYGRKMIVNEMSITNGSTNTVLTVIDDFNQHISYSIVGMYCVKSNLTIAMGGNCVPENAVYLATIDIAGVVSDVWFLNQTNTTSRLTVSKDNCVPIQEIELTLGDVSLLGIVNVQNVTAGIANPSIFNVPQICNQSAIYHHMPPFATILSMPHLFKHKSMNPIIT